MPAELLILPEANGDLTRAVEWYEAQRRGLGDEFYANATSRFESILRNPDLFELFHGDVRRAAVGRFPYDILFRSSDDCVIIVCVVHHSRDEHVWRSRLVQGE
ncbi:MAG: type II toxin-antitoxin system RelE/ParE family toxin [Planctomycetaceae bacterium]